MGKRVLVIDDEAAISEVIRIVLECEGYVTDVLPTGEHVIDSMQQHMPDVILLDFSLPGETGDKIARRLKSVNATRDIPIIMLSAHHAIEQVAYSSGVNAFLPKPFSIDDLLQIIELTTKYRN